MSQLNDHYFQVFRQSEWVCPWLSLVFEFAAASLLFFQSSTIHPHPLINVSVHWPLIETPPSLSQDFAFLVSAQWYFSYLEFLLFSSMSIIHMYHLRSSSRAMSTMYLSLITPSFTGLPYFGIHSIVPHLIVTYWEEGWSFMLVCWGYHKEVPQTWRLKQQTFVCLQFQR